MTQRIYDSTHLWLNAFMAQRIYGSTHLWLNAFMAKRAFGSSHLWLIAFMPKCFPGCFLIGWLRIRLLIKSCSGQTKPSGSENRTTFLHGSFGNGVDSRKLIIAPTRVLQESATS